MSKKLFGRLKDGRPVFVYGISNGRGIGAEILAYGAAVFSLSVPDKNGESRDVVLAHADLDGYLANSCFFGVLVGRYANRISGAAFELGGKRYELEKNDGKNHLHGGPGGMHHALWSLIGEAPDCVTLGYRSPDGEEGYPGNLDVRITYTVTEDGALRLEYEAAGDADTPVNLTNHSYFNLNGHGSGPVLGHRLQINAASFVPTDAELIPTGRLRDVAGTPYDFTSEQSIGGRIDGQYDQLSFGGGYDQCFALDGQAVCEYHGRPVRLGAALWSPESGIRMEVLTTEPGIQLYTANQLSRMQGKRGAQYGRRGAACLEAGNYPNAVNEPRFPNAVLKKGETYRQMTSYWFSIA